MVPEDCNKLSKPSSSHNILPESSSTMAIHSSKSTIELTPGEHVTTVWLNEDNGELQWGYISVGEFTFGERLKTRHEILKTARLECCDALPRGATQCAAAGSNNVVPIT